MRDSGRLANIIMTARDKRVDERVMVVCNTDCWWQEEGAKVESTLAVELAESLSLGRKGLAC